MERSCMCCQESGEREASVSLFCPKAKQGEKKFRKVYCHIILMLIVEVNLLKKILSVTFSKILSRISNEGTIFNYEVFLSLNEFSSM